MTWTSLDTWIVVTGMLSAAACALPGAFLLLRRMSMMGDAISHAVLPGLAAAFLLTGSRGSITMFLGAAAVGLLTALFTQWISRFGKVEESASMGVVFTSLFALGLIMIVQAADAVDLDPGCVLYGAIELTPLDTVALAGFDVPRAALQAGAILLLNAVVIGLLYKELKISSFDPELASSVGVPAGRMHYLLMAMVAVTTVACFESVGSILVIAMLVVPPATAFLIAGRLPALLGLSVLIAAATAALGHVAAITVPAWFGFADTSTAGMMAVAAGVVFTLAMIASPRSGVLTKAYHRARLSVRIAAEDILGLAYRREESGPAAGVPLSDLRRRIYAPAWVFRWALRELDRSAWVVVDAGVLRLTDAGRASARDLLRSHRLWESFLHEEVGVRADHVHGTSERLEHVTDAGLQAELARRVAREEDPHGHRIPGGRGGG